jgi:hypothetical protein
LDLLDCWTLANHSPAVDGFHLIRGFVPMELSVGLTSILHDHKYTTKILTKGFTTLYEDIRKHIWTIRNELFVNFERSLDITTDMKRSRPTTSVSSPYRPRTHGIQHITNPYSDTSHQTWQSHAIKFGFKWSDF